jgi:hypothetical protein
MGGRVYPSLRVFALRKYLTNFHEMYKRSNIKIGMENLFLLHVNLYTIPILHASQKELTSILKKVSIYTNIEYKPHYGLQL